MMYGAKLRMIRIARGFTQEETARKVHMATNTYCKWETDQVQKWPDDVLQKFAEVLNVSVADITSPTPIIFSFSNSLYTDSIQPQKNNSFAENCIKILEDQIKVLNEQLLAKDKMIEKLLQCIK